MIHNWVDVRVSFTSAHFFRVVRARQWTLYTLARVGGHCPPCCAPLTEGADLLPAGCLDVAEGIRTAPSGVNSDARRSWSFIITASVNSPRSASISTRSVMA